MRREPLTDTPELLRLLARGPASDRKLSSERCVPVRFHWKTLPPSCCGIGCASPFSFAVPSARMFSRPSSAASSASLMAAIVWSAVVAIVLRFS